MKKVGCAFLLLVLGAAAVGGWLYIKNPDRFMPKDPEVSFNRVEFKSADADGIKLDVFLNVTNPNEVGAVVDGYTIDFTLKDIRLVDADLDRSLDLRAGKTAELLVPVSATWQDIERLQGQRLPKELPYRALGKLKFQTPLGVVRVPYDVADSMPVVIPPKVTPKSARLGRVSAAGVEMQGEVELSNPNAVPIRVIEMRWTVDGPDGAAADGRLTRPFTLPPYGTHTAPISGAFDIGGLAGAIMNGLSAPGGLDGTISGTVTMDIGKGPFSYSFSTGRQNAGAQP